MSSTKQRFILVSSEHRSLQLAYDAFMVAQEAARHSPLTLKWYAQRLGRFLEFLKAHKVTDPGSITPTHCRSFIVELARRGLKDTTIHGYAQVIKTFCRFLEREDFAPANAMAHVTMPKVAKRIMPAFTPSDVKALLEACKSARDTAIILCLLDSGARASEFVALRIADVDLRTGTTRILRGKGGKYRVCYLGARARKALIKYLRERKGAKDSDPLWLSENTGEALTYWGVAQLLRRLGKRANVSPCSPHTFRRTFALWSLRAGMSVYHLQAIMGHSDLQVLRRYLALVEADAEEAHRRFGPVDNLL